MEPTLQLLPFRLDDRRFGLPVTRVERVLQAIEVVPLPKAPDVVLGVINHWGRVLPVYNLRRRFRLPERALGLSDHLILVDTPGRPAALPVDAVEVATSVGEGALTACRDLLPGLEHLQGICALEDGLLLIHDPQAFLLLDEERDLNRALEEIS